MSIRTVMDQLVHSVIDAYCCTIERIVRAVGKQSLGGSIRAITSLLFIWQERKYQFSTSKTHDFASKKWWKRSVVLTIKSKTWEFSDRYGSREAWRSGRWRLEAWYPHERLCGDKSSPCIGSARILPGSQCNLRMWASFLTPPTCIMLVSFNMGSDFGSPCGIGLARCLMDMDELEGIFLRLRWTNRGVLHT